MVSKIEELQRFIQCLESKNQDLVIERDHLAMELHNIKATQTSGDGSDYEGEISSDAARKRLFRLVKRAADGPLAL